MSIICLNFFILRKLFIVGWIYGDIIKIPKTACKALINEWIAKHGKLKHSARDNVQLVIRLKGFLIVCSSLYVLVFVSLLIVVRDYVTIILVSIMSLDTHTSYKNSYYPYKAICLMMFLTE